MNNNMQKGAWWHAPSLLEPMPGPWCGYEIYGMDVVEGWKRILDWHAEHGLTTLITQIGPHFKDRTVLGWGFHYVLDFAGHPEARTFSENFVGRNRERLHGVLEYARQSGISVYLHHYNFMAPKNFVEAHEPLLRKWKINADRLPEQQDMGSLRVYCDRLRTLYGNLCWREPVYKEFMVALWHELFDTFPSLAGIVSTPGENQYCFCPDCTRGAERQDYAEWMRAREQIKHEFLSDFVRTFREVMKARDKHAVMRLWGMKTFQSELLNKELYPDDITYLVKYRWFDAVDAGPDPLVTEWMSQGYDTWVADDLWGENAGPTQWNRPRYFRELAQQCERLGVSGILSHQNADWCTAAIPGWVQGLSLKCFCHYLANPLDEDDSWVDREYLDKFGLAGTTIRQCVEDYSEFVLNITKLVIIGCEGYTFSMVHPIFPGKIGRIGNPIPDWVRGEVAMLKDCVDYVAEHGWEDGTFEKVYQGRKGPFDALHAMQSKAKSALVRLNAVRHKVPADALGELDYICTSARICLHLAEDCEHAFRARVYFEAWHEDPRGEIRRQLAQWTVEEMEASIAALYQVREDVLELPTSSLDFSRTLRDGLDGYSFLIDSWHGINIEGRKTELKEFRQLVDAAAKTSC